MSQQGDNWFESARLNCYLIDYFYHEYVSNILNLKLKFYYYMKIIDALYS